MSTFHEQAMSFVYQQVLHRLLGLFNRHERVALQLLIQRLLVAAGGIERIGHFRVMVVHEGGKESAYTLAFLRAAQLSISARAPDTFILRLVVLRQPRLTPSVMTRFQSQCNELFLYDDGRVELLHVDESGAQILNRHTLLNERPPELNRMQVLMSGHLSQGEARVTFLYADLLSRAKLFRTACLWGSPVSALIDRRPPQHLGEYAQWMLRVAEHLGYVRPTGYGNAIAEAVHVCTTLDDDFKYLLCQQPPAGEAYQPMTGSGMAIINVFDCLSHETEVLSSPALLFTEGPWPAQTFNIEEPQVAVILIAAHVQGLRSHYQTGNDYCSGVCHYLQNISAENALNERYKGQLTKLICATFNTPKRIQKLRLQMEQYLNDIHGLTNEQLNCLIESPFVEQGAGLVAFLQRHYPDKLQWANDLHHALGAHDEACARHSAWLQSISGLPLGSLQMLYTMRKVDCVAGQSLIDLMCTHDPHKGVP